MPTVDQHSAGHASWVELATSDVVAAQPFYEGLFGWTCRQVAPDGPGAYFMWHHNGLEVAGMYTVAGPLVEKGVTPHWMVYFATDDADALAGRVREVEGGVLFPPFDVGESGRSVWCSDRHGAMFSGWQAKAHCGMKVTGEPGTLNWVELATPELDRSIEFYTHVFGWKALERTPDERGIPTRYVEWMVGETHVGGALQMTDEWKGVPPHWVPYFEVADCDAAVETAQRLGGKAPYGAFGMAGVGRLAVIQDPQSVTFMVIQPSH
ncbi:MAG: VOC family protein [Bryobacterales bacterium]|nr:VOC family protein [Bryobacterales bacterium]